MRSQGVKLEITNTVDATRSLLMECRILIGTHSIERAPTFFEVFDRRIPVKLTRSRWFDICLTRDEAFIADNKLTFLIGASTDPRFITVIDDNQMILFYSIELKMHCNNFVLAVRLPYPYYSKQIATHRRHPRPPPLLHRHHLRHRRRPQ